MSIEELKQEIEKLQARINSKSTPDAAKKVFTDKLQKAQSDLSKLMDKGETESKKVIADVEKKTKIVEKKDVTPKPPKAKAEVKDKIKETKSKVDEAKGESVGKAEDLKQEVEKLQARINSKSTPDAAKKVFAEKLQKAQADYDKLMGKAQDENKKMVADAEKKIVEVEKEIENPNIPKKVKTQIKEKLKETKKKVEEAQKETKKVDKEIEPSSTGVKKRGRPKKETATAIPKTKRKLESTLEKLKNLIKKTSQLNERYNIAKEGFDVGDINLIKDAGRPAKPFGARVRGKGITRKPTKQDYEDGLVYKESRPNRADVYPKKIIKL